MSDETITLVSPDGKATTVATKDAGPYLAAGFKAETSEAAAERIGTEARQRDISKATTLGQTALSGATLGLSDAAQRAFGGEDAARYLRDVRDAHPTYATVGNVVGAVAPAILTGGESIAADVAAATPIGRAAQIGRSIGSLGEGGGALAKIGYKALGGAAEGGLIGAGQGVSELALDDHPITWEHAVSALSSNALFGAGVGGGIGAVAGTFEHGLGKAKRALDEAAAARAVAPEVTEDLAGLDRQGLKAARTSELDRIEGERVPARKQLADDIGSFREDVKQQKIWLATKDATDRETREIGKISLEADKALDRTLRNPIALAENPQRALSALQQQENALTKLVGKADPLRASFGADQSGARAAALDAAPGALERNRALQGRIRDLAAEAKSPRLAAIEDAHDALSAPTPKKSVPEEILGGSIFHHVSNAVGAVAGNIPLAGGAIGLVAGAKVARLVTDAVFGRLGKLSAEQLAKTSAVVDAVAGVAKKTTAEAPMMASTVLGRVRFAPPTPGETPPAPPTRKTKASTPALAESYKARSAEIRSQTAYDATGTPRMRPDARAAMAAQLSPIRHVAPVAADRMETIAARRIEYLAACLPRKPDAMASMLGPSQWQPSDMEMRAFARKVMAVEHPDTVERRLIDGSLVPEDVAAYRAVYPERAAALERSIVAKASTMTTSLPFSRRLALSIFTGRPHDPSLDPRILSRLQSQFAAEEGTGGGTRPPTAKPAFGSVKSNLATPSQQRESVMR